MDEPEQRCEAKALRSLAVASWAVCVGIFSTTLVLLPLLPALSAQGPVHHADIPEVSVLSSATTVPWQQALQKRIYLLNCMVCPLLAWLSLRFRARLGGWSCLISFVLFVPAIFAVYRGIFQAQPRFLPFLGAGLILSLPCLSWRWLTGAISSLAQHRVFPRYNTEASKAISASTGLSTMAPAHSWLSRFQSDTAQGWLFPILLLSLMVIFLMPWNVHQGADALQQEVHLSSYLIGPALSLLKPGAAPALDFESHYGLGHAYVFSFFLGSSFHDTLCNYLWFLFLVLTFYLVSAYFVLAEVFRSRGAAFLLTVLLLALSMEGLTYRCPSNWPIRFPFLFLFIGCAGWKEGRGRIWMPALLSGGFAGLSLFWQTDIGILLGATGAVYFAALVVRERRGFLRLPCFLVSAGLTFVLLAVAAFGPRTFSILFYQRLLEPLLLYASGFGFIGMRWQDGWPYVYNVIAPVITLATLGYAVKQLHAQEAERQRQARYLFLFGTSGLLMLFKWVNRSIDPIWSMNAPAIIVVLFWWCRSATGALGEFLTREGDLTVSEVARLRLRTRCSALVVGSLLGVGIFVSFFHDPTGVRGYSTSPLVRLKSFTSETPTLAHQIIGKVRTLMPLSAQANPVDPQDVALIRDHSGATEPVAVLAALDWAYLAEAKRAPAFAWVPVYYTHSFSLLTRAEKTVRQTQRLFIERESFAQLQTTHPDLHQRILSILQTDFAFKESGKALDMYCHKPD